MMVYKHSNHFVNYKLSFFNFDLNTVAQSPRSTP